MNENKKLSEQELQNPFEALKNVFENFSPSEMEMDLTDVEQQLIDRTFSHDKDSMEYDNTLHFFENLHKMAQAAYLMYSAYQQGLDRLN